jgi:hypothetical protein
MYAEEMEQEYAAPGYPGLGPRFGMIRGVWYLQEGEELVTIVEEEAAHGHWWILYRRMNDEWVEMEAFASDGSLSVQPHPLFAVVVDVATPVDLSHTVFLVVEDGVYYRWWVVHSTAGVLRGPLVMFAAPKQAFVVPI